MKRFTETTKWSDPWFRKLDPKFKAFWLYLVDSCDVAGVWDADMELASFQIGVSFNESESLTVFGDRIRKLDSGKWLLTKFISFQYGTLNPENNFHKSVFKSLDANKIVGPNKAQIRPFHGPQYGNKINKERTEGESEGKQFPDPLNVPEFRTAWDRWQKHRREIKKKLTPEMEEASLKKLATYGLVTAIRIIEFTLEKGWQGLAYDEGCGRGILGAPAARPQFNDISNNKMT